MNRRAFLSTLAAFVALPTFYAPPPPPDLRSKPRLFQRDTPPTGDSVSLLLVGDCSFARGTAQLIADRGADFDYPLQRVSDWLAAADITAGNQEGVIAPADAVTMRAAGIRLRADPFAATALSRAGFNLMTLANNHSLDFGEEGLRMTMTALRDAGMVTVGAGNGDAAARTPVFTTVRRIKIGWLAYTQVADPPMLNDEGAGIGRAWLNEKTIEDEVTAARAQCDTLIVQCHWGNEYEPEPFETQVRLAHKITDAGASLLIGHHPHVSQSVLAKKQSLICYSLGNFLFDQAWGSGFAVWARVDRDGLLDAYRLHLVPGTMPAWVL